VGNENAASRIRTYEHQIIPGLLQTQEYALALFKAANPSAEPEENSERLRVRMGRQSLITRTDDPIRFEVVLDEAVISRPVGGDKVMREQLKWLCATASMPNVAIHLLPFEAGAHAAMEGTFAILDFPESDGTSLVYAENATGGLFLDKERELQLYLENPAALNELPLEFIDDTLCFHPEWVVDKIAPRPILFITTDDDRLVPPEESEQLFAKAGEPKKLVILRGCGHYEVYAEPAFSQVMSPTTAWFREHLPHA
jgi:pimeloyl-ACP methyl ester carboxylesterase